MAEIGHNKISLQNLNDDARKRVKKAVLEIDESLTRIASERDLQKEILTKLEEELGVEKKMVRKLARTYFKQDFKMQIADQDEFETAYQEIVEKTV